ncbi:hypothetical protein DL93DRAFT_841199 [Clavulina sp. PMI_390]|nr:hypothetical protein DL93DRAFT_841199 [Clavulina sp. PMI_390]
MGADGPYGEHVILLPVKFPSLHDFKCGLDPWSFEKVEGILDSYRELQVVSWTAYFLAIEGFTVLLAKRLIKHPTALSRGGVKTSNLICTEISPWELEEYEEVDAKIAQALRGLVSRLQGLNPETRRWDEIVLSQNLVAHSTQIPKVMEEFVMLRSSDEVDHDEDVDSLTGVGLQPEPPALGQGR